MEASPSVHREAEMLGSGGKRGGWIISLFIIGLSLFFSHSHSHGQRLVHVVYLCSRTFVVQL